ncbi:heterokaryon incompatibility protein-domain-containing protein [Phaeosphaeria sp. MPI-PUGE-AT-0046c]|nr:heterokaryon incompatibility protein-domain-containing protein [Phaeosphaeria sp. MPI-PUGE-AT-0046c]
MPTATSTLSPSSTPSEQNTGKSSSIYAAAPLVSTNSIRLLEFDPLPAVSTSIDSPSEISCKLYSVDLTTCPRYVTLSYMWGNEPAARPILINGETFLVRENLWTFLKRARDESPPFHGPLWIDAICIDQDNVLERNHQVLLMGDIYTNAHLVISWLGADDEQYAEGLDYVTELSEIGPLTSGLASFNLDLPKLENLAQIYLHEYWKRTWIIQEVVLPLDAEIWIGPSRRIRHQTLTELEMWLYVWPKHLKSQLTHMSGIRILDQRAVRHNYEPQGALKIGYDATDFFTLLHTTKTTRCKDVRDRVFAILALIPAGERARLDIVPDYTMSTLELCKVVEGKVRDALGHGVRSCAIFSDLVREVLEIGLDGNLEGA